MSDMPHYYQHAPVLYIDPEIIFANINTLSSHEDISIQLHNKGCHLVFKSQGVLYPDALSIQMSLSNSESSGFCPNNFITVAISFNSEWLKEPCPGHFSGE